MSQPARAKTTTPPWTIVLAAGEGTRLRALTRALHGEDLPKQFARILGRDSLLQATLRRTSRWSPAERTVVVVAEERLELAREQVAGFGPVDVVAQPRNIGTGPGVLLPLSHVFAADPEAVVAIIPSDHYVSDEASFVDSVRRAEQTALRDDSIVLVAAVPEGPETQYGWIVVDEKGEGHAHKVAAFVEKPGQKAASELYDSGALWNTFVMVGRAKHFWELARRHLGAQTALFESYLAALGTDLQGPVLSRLYERIEPADYSKDVLQKSTSLSVVSLAPCGWSDWGTPERVFKSLEGTRHLDELTERMRPPSAPRAKPLESSPIQAAEDRDVRLAS